MRKLSLALLLILVVIGPIIVPGNPVKAATDSYGTVNLAKNKPITPLTNTVVGKPADVNDGNVDSVWYSFNSNYGGNSNASSFVLDMGSVYSIGKIDIFPSQIHGFTINTSDDNNTWTERYKSPWATTSVGGPISVTPDGAFSARYIKYWGYANWSQYVGVLEINVYEWLASPPPPPSGANGSISLALNKTATNLLGSVLQSNPPAYVVDGNSATSWASSKSDRDDGTGKWLNYGQLKIDLGAKYTIGKVVISPQRVHDFRMVMAETDPAPAGSPWIFMSYPELFGTTKTSGDPYTFSLNGSITARYIWLTTDIWGTPSSLQPAIAEIEVYEWVASSTPPTTPAPTTPVISNVSPVIAAQTQTITISGKSFGSQNPYNGNSAYLTFTDVTAAVWAAGCPSCAVTLNVTSWTDSQIVVSGFTGPYGSSGWVLNPGDKVQIQVWNPQFAGAGAASYSTTVSAGAPPGQVPAPTSSPSTPPSAPAQAGTVGYWSFNEGSGTTARDGSGNGNDGAVSGPTWAPGKSGNGLNFDGNADSVKLPHSAINGLADITFAAWIKTNINKDMGIITGANSATDNEFLLFIEAGSLSTTVKKQTFVTKKKINDGQWHFIAVTRAGNTGEVLVNVDGQLDASNNLTAGNLVIDPNGLWLGREQDSVGGGWDTEQDFQGSMDEVAIYNRVFSQAEIQGLMSGVSPQPPLPATSAPTATPAPAPVVKATDASLTAEERTVSPNSTTTVPIRLDKADRLGSLNFSLRYDPSVLKVNKAESGDLAGGTLFQASIREAGIIRFGVVAQGTAGVTGDGPVAHVEFTALGARGAQSQLTLGDLLATDTSGARLGVTLRSGRVTIAAKLKGDYDGDGKLTAKDSLAALKMSVAELPEDLNLDMDGDGRVTAEDARRILSEALGSPIITSALPLPSTPATLSVSDNQAGKSAVGASPAPQRVLPPATPPPYKPVTGTIRTGASVEAGAAAIGPEGGSATLRAPGTPVDNLVLTVPAKGYTDRRTFKVSYTAVTGTTFGSNFNPISPVISIENGGGYSDDMMTVTIPVNIPSGHFAMGFFWDEASQRLEGIPVLEETSGSITLATRHFSKLIVSSISETLLKDDVDSGFRPGIDDWEFPNNGSYIAPGGHCAGQSIAAMWYYVEKPDGPDVHLWGQYDNNGRNPATEGLWLDDSLGYRFVSTIHQDFNQGSFGNSFFSSLARGNDSLVWNSFVYSMKATGEPQYVGLTDTGPDGGGHAMVAYRVQGDTLWISDPNFPSDNYRQIKYVNGKFQPYSSAANTDDLAKGKHKKYDLIRYMAKSAAVSWPTIRERWDELKKETIGNARFPEYELKYYDERGELHELIEGTAIGGTKLEPMNDVFFVNESDARVAVFRDGKQLPWDDKGRVDLVPGNNLLGFFIGAMGDGRVQYIDFKYLNVVSGRLPVAVEAVIAIPTPYTLGPDSEPYYAFGTPVNPITVRLGGSIKGDAGLKFEGAEFYSVYGGERNITAFVYSIPANATNSSLDFDGLVMPEAAEPATKIVKVIGTKPQSEFSTFTDDATFTWVGWGGNQSSGRPMKMKLKPIGEKPYPQTWTAGKPLNCEGCVALDPNRNGEGTPLEQAGGMLFRFEFQAQRVNQARDLQTGTLGLPTAPTPGQIPGSQAIVIRLVKR